VVEARGRIEFFVGAAETEFQDEVLRRGVGRMMSCEEGFRAGVFEGEIYDGAGRFFGEAAPPVGAKEMNAQFEDAILQAIGAETGAAGVLVRFEKENRPVLDGVKRVELHLRAQPFLNFFERERAAGETCDFGVSPEGLS